MKRSLLIYGENFINDQNTYTLSSGSGEEYLYDQKYSTQCISALSFDGTEESIQIDFKDRDGDLIEREIDTLILLNCNYKNFKIEYWNGTSWVGISEADYTSKDNTKKDILLELGTCITTTGLKITASSVVDGSDEKRLGEFKACKYILEVKSPFDLTRSDWENGGSYRLYNGKLINFVYVCKADGNLSFNYLPKQDYDKIISKIKDKEWLTIVPYVGIAPEAVYEIKASSPISGHRYDWVTDRFSFSFDFKER